MLTLGRDPDGTKRSPRLAAGTGRGERLWGRARWIFSGLEVLGLADLRVAYRSGTRGLVGVGVGSAFSGIAGLAPRSVVGGGGIGGDMLPFGL